jgi:predicted transglutaminase-like cysteine proteinase
VVLTPNFVRHAVLTVATDEGNFVLDNLHDEIVAWDKTQYVFLERQDPASVSGWVSLR